MSIVNQANRIQRITINKNDAAYKLIFDKDGTHLDDAKATLVVSPKIAAQMMFEIRKLKNTAHGVATIKNKENCLVKIIKNTVRGIASWIVIVNTNQQVYLNVNFTDDEACAIIDERFWAMEVLRHAKDTKIIRISAD